MTKLSVRRTVRAVAVTTAVLTTGLMLGACGGEEGSDTAAPAVPSGWKKLAGPTVSLAYPAGLAEQGKAERGKLNDAAALRTEGGRPTVKVSIQSGFADASTGDDAASVGRALLMATTEVKSTKNADIKGAKGARRIDFTYTGTGSRSRPRRARRSTAWSSRASTPTERSTPSASTPRRASSAKRTGRRSSTASR